MAVNRSATMFVCQLPEWEQREFAARAWLSIVAANEHIEKHHRHRMTSEEMQEALENATSRRICDVSEYVDNAPFVDGTVCPMAFDGEELLKVYDFAHAGVTGDDVLDEEFWTLEPAHGVEEAAFFGECPDSGYFVTLSGCGAFSADGMAFDEFTVEGFDTTGAHVITEHFSTYSAARDYALGLQFDLCMLPRVVEYDYSGRL